MSFKTQKFSVDQMARHLDYLKLYEQEGEPLDFEILIDGMRAIRRTSNTGRFSLYENFITEDTVKVELMIYHGTSNHNDKYIYSLKVDASHQEQSLGEIDSKIEERVKEAERKWKQEQLVKENALLKEEIASLEEELSRMEKDREESLSKESPLKGLLGEVGASFVESFIRNNPGMIKGLPGGVALSGLLDKGSAASDQQENTEVTFASKQNGSTAEDQGMLTFASELRSSFSKEEFPIVIEILQAVAKDKSKLQSTLKHLTIGSHEI